MIVAPPGYGKTTLLREWDERDERPFIWLKLADSASGSTEAIAEALEQAEAFVLVVDDAHSVSRLQLRSALMPLLGELPYGSALAIASRTEPPLPIGRLRAHRALVELRMHDLAMTATEAETLLRGAGMELELEQVRVLTDRTEGWPAALYLAALSLREDAGAAGPEQFAGDNHLLGEFLRDEVLAAVPADLNEFLMRTAVLEELSGPLCDDVLGERGSALALGRLEKESQLLVALDRAHHSFRWQRLFAEALRAELRRSEPELEPRLQLRASAWYARRGERIVRSATRSRRGMRSGPASFCGPASPTTSGTAAPRSSRGG